MQGIDAAGLSVAGAVGLMRNQPLLHLALARGGAGGPEKPVHVTLRVRPAVEASGAGEAAEATDWLGQSDGPHFHPDAPLYAL